MKQALVRNRERNGKRLRPPHFDKSSHFILCQSMTRIDRASEHKESTMFQLNNNLFQSCESVQHLRKLFDNVNKRFLRVETTTLVCRPEHEVDRGQFAKSDA